MGSPFPGPVPPYSNPPIEPQFYAPSQFTISNVVLGQTTTVTTSVNNNYVVGNLVRLLIPQLYGCWQLNEMTGYVISIPMPNQVEVSIDSSQNVNAYIALSLPPLNPYPVPQIVCVGDVNTGLINSQGPMNTGLTIPGSFTNISPL